MIRTLLLASTLAIAGNAFAEGTGCTSPESRQLDFWLGDWDLAYTQGGKALQSRNRVTKILDGCAVLEEFSGPPGIPLMGRSVSMFDRTVGQWKQTWVDNEGSYLDFTGGLEGGRMVLAREFEREGKRIRQRMVFEDITADALTWRWQRSTDGGASWSTMWEIAYRRARPR